MLALPAPSLSRHLARTIYAASLTHIPDEYSTPPMTAAQRRKRERQQKRAEKRRWLEFRLKQPLYRVSVQPEEARIFVIASSTQPGGVFLSRIVELSKPRALKKHRAAARAEGVKLVTTAVMPI